MIRGIDVSALQGAIDWKAARAAGVRFAYAQAVEGNRPVTNPRFRQNVDGSRAAGIWPGCYNFAYPLPNPGEWHDPAAQAQHHFDLSGGFGTGMGELPPMLDFEWPAPSDWGKWGCTAAELCGWLVRYLQAADALWEQPVGLYTYPDFWSNAMGGRGATLFAGWAADPATRDLVANRPLWMADYRTNGEWPAEEDVRACVKGDAPHIVRPWQDHVGEVSGSGLPLDWTFWQIGQRMLPGSKGGPACDLDVFNGTEDQMSVLAGGNP